MITAKTSRFFITKKKDQWSLSLAYDLTWSNTYYGEHTATVDGNGRDPGMKELLAGGKAVRFSVKRCRDIAEKSHAETSPLEAKYRNCE